MLFGGVIGADCENGMVQNTLCRQHAEFLNMTESVGIPVAPVFPE